ncbi:hypothetical protein C8R46DRAFT_1228753 [Mycena filopes]|nr:hypothetical protein C8R46DRAFT_1228753 [Mycena filopes]
MSSSKFSVKSPRSLFKALNSLRPGHGVRLVGKDAEPDREDAATAPNPSNIQPYPETHKVLYVTTEFRADEALRGIVDGVGG